MDYQLSSNVIDAIMQHPTLNSIHMEESFGDIDVSYSKIMKLFDQSHINVTNVCNDQPTSQHEHGGKTVLNICVNTDSKMGKVMHATYNGLYGKK